MSNINNQQQRIKKKVKSHIPKDWLTETRIIFRITLETLNGIRRTGWVNLAIITTMAIALTIFGTLFRASISLSSFMNVLGNSLEISVYLKPNTPIAPIVEKIKLIEHVESIKTITKEEAWKELKLEMDVSDVENPLPDTLHVKIDKPKNIQSVSKTIQSIPGIESINYAKEIAKKIQLIVNVVHTMIMIVVLVSSIFTITIINNTIHLVIQSRKEEIEIMRLMGVSNWYIKTPLILQGSIYGFLGTLIALFPLNFFHKWLLSVHEFFLVSSPGLAINIVILAMFIMAIGFGACGSFLSIKKHLKV